jgi:hypothetical protein
VKFPWIDVRDIEVAARGLLLKAFGADGRNAARVDLDALVCDYLCEKDGLSFDDEHDLGWEKGEQILGRTKPIAGRIEIAASLKVPKDLGRYRFTLAHEIGHWVLHRPLYLVVDESLDLFESHQSDIALASIHRSVFPNRAESVPPEEWQANHFAIALLIDSHTLRHEFVGRFGAPVVAHESAPRRSRSQTLREHSRTLAAERVRGLSSLATVFDLSVEAMAIALEERGYSVSAQPAL